MKKKFHFFISSLTSIGGFYLITYRHLFSFVFKQWYRLSLYLAVFLTLLFLPGQNKYEMTKLLNKSPFFPALAVDYPAPYPVNLHKTNPPELSASGVYVVDVQSGVPLYEINAHEVFQPASTTKIMTALVALDFYQLDDIVSSTSEKTEGRTMGLTKGEKITIETLLYGLLIHSANDAALTLAENFPGGIDGFVEAMNEKAKDLHLTQTHFTNPAGFEDQNHYMSARDLARLSLVALVNPIISRISSIRSISVSDATFTRFHELTNVNQLLGKIPGVAGFKTGWTENAGECLVALQVKEKAKVLSVLLHSSDRFGETEKLLSWVGENFVWEQPLAP